MTYDLLQRRLEDAGHEVRLVRNITDVDEPIYKKAAEIGIPYTELAARETASFQQVLHILNFREPYAQPLASGYIPQMAAAVQQLVNNGYGYTVGEDIYFDTARVQSFGRFSGFNHRLLMNFMRGRGGDPERKGKRQPLDFLLWKGVSDPHDSAAWDSPVGRGRPGWHIECTVMSEECLGTPFDLHGGGSDLIFPHHECELAQSKGLGQPAFARHWLHVAPLLFAGEKMSKSLGNLVFAKDLLGRHEAAVIRLSLMYYHYRIGGEWQPALLTRAETLWHALKAAGQHITQSSADDLLARVRAALDNDLDTHQLMHALKDAAHSHSSHGDGSGRHTLQATLQLLGLEA